tara:strand:+ start:426 stop:1025 length:600 start_codon:yes stop_codon:yes gene_type:complete
MEERYKRGKIYTIRCRYDDTLIYVGSTIETLSKRFGGHKADSKRKMSMSLYTYVNKDWDNWYIELYEDYPCNNKQLLLKREGEIIREIGTINKQIAGRTKEEYRLENIDKDLENRKIYYQNNREKILNDKKIYLAENLDKIKERNKKHREDNIDKYIKKDKDYYEKNKYKVICDVCGTEITKINLKAHQKTKKCVNFNN